MIGYLTGRSVDGEKDNHLLGRDENITIISGEK